MEGLLVILIIIVAVVMSNTKKKMRQEAVRPVRPDVSELQAKRALENRMEQTMLPLSLRKQEPEEDQEEKNESAFRAQKPESRIPEKMMMERMTAEPMEGTIQTEGKSPGKKKAAPEKRDNAAVLLQDENDLEFVSKLDQQEMVRAVILSEILKRRPQERNRRYS